MANPVTFGKYQLLERINVGGMAEVFKAKTFGIEGFQRLLAIKRILPNMAEDDEFITMFVDEARIAVQLNHPNIVPIYELGKFETQYYIAMEYVSGCDLRQMSERFRKSDRVLPVSVAVFIASKLCEGLDYAHRKADSFGRPLNVIHRDVSPQNILLSYDGAVKITDFGIARAESRSNKTQAGVLKGKFGYMSPEQVTGGKVDHRADIFALGILLWEMLTGKRLFAGESDFVTLEKVRQGLVELPSSVNPSVSGELESVVMKALAKEPSERYAWASEFFDALQPFLFLDAGVFNEKKMSAFMKAEYQEEMLQEQRKVEAFMQIPVPESQEAWTHAEHMKKAPVVSGDWTGEAHGERTVIFNAPTQGFENASTQIFESPFNETQLTQTHFPLSEQHTGVAETPFKVPSVEQPKKESFQPPVVFQERAGLKRATPWVLGSMVVVLAVLLGVLLTKDTEVAKGSLVVTSTPVEQVELFIDGEKAGSRTPFIKSDIAVGEHVLLAKAKGFSDRVYRFDVSESLPVEVRVELKASAEANRVLEGVVEIVSEPTMASVRVGGLPQGVTPMVLSRQDLNKPLTIDIVKTGYVSKQETVVFAPGEKHRTLKVVLEKEGAMAGESFLSVSTQPAGVEVWIDGVKRGVSPLEITDLNPSVVHKISLQKRGYYAINEVFKFSEKGTARISIGLKRDTPEEDVPAEEEATDSADNGYPDAPKPSEPSATSSEPRSPPVKKPKPSKGLGGCSGTGSQLSVMPQGVADCQVNVGSTVMGVAPFFKKAAPVGKCLVTITCPDGRTKESTMDLEEGKDAKWIIKPTDW